MVPIMTSAIGTSHLASAADRGIHGAIVMRRYLEMESVPQLVSRLPYGFISYSGAVMTGGLHTWFPTVSHGDSLRCWPVLANHYGKSILIGTRAWR